MVSGIRGKKSKALKYLRQLGKDERGIAGVEAAILVLSFFVVASLIGFTVIQVGTSASSDIKSTVNTDIVDTLPGFKLKGAIMGLRAGDGKADPFYVGTVRVSVVSYGASAVQLSKSSLLVTYFDSKQYVTDLPWSARWLRGDGARDILDPDELVEISLDLSGLNPKLRESTKVTLEFQPLHWGATKIDLRTSPSLDPFMNLDW